jgi:hypothetical protein
VNGEPVYFGSYREVFSRDLYETFTALLVEGDLITAQDTTRFLLNRQQLPDGRLPHATTPLTPGSTRPHLTTFSDTSRTGRSPLRVHTDHAISCGWPRPVIRTRRVSTTLRTVRRTPTNARSWTPDSWSLSDLASYPPVTPTCSSLKAVDATIRRDTPNGVGFYHYGTSTPGSSDGYGDCYQPGPTDCTPSGRPWPTGDTGSGHLWPVLSGERGEQECGTGAGLGATSATHAGVERLPTVGTTSDHPCPLCRSTATRNSTVESRTLTSGTLLTVTDLTTPGAIVDVTITDNDAALDR